MAPLRTRSQTIVIDGMTYRWRASHRAIMVEHADPRRGRLREFLTLSEHVGPGRIVQLVRHAIKQGWQPAIDDKVFGLPPVSVWDDPRIREHYEWMQLLRRQLHHLEEFLGCPVEVGAYWWHGSNRVEAGGLGARLRFGPCELFGENEVCEAAYCITGIEGLTSYSDVFVFPFHEGVNLGLDDEKCWVLWLKQDCEKDVGIWRSLGTESWYAPDQWSFASEPGRIFYALSPTAHEISAEHGQPIPVQVPLTRPGNRSEQFMGGLHLVEESSRGSIIKMGTGNCWFRWEEVAAVEVSRTDGKVLIEVDVAQLPIAGGWTPGNYRVMLRIRSEFGRGEGQSDITAPIDIKIA